MKKWIIAAAGFCVIGLVILGVVLFLQRNNDDNHIYVYFYNPSSRRLEAEMRPLPDGDAVMAVLNYLHEGPNAGAHISVWPYEAHDLEDLVTSVMMEDSMLLVFFSPIYYTMAPIEQSLFKTAFVESINSLIDRSVIYVSDVKILVTDDYEYAFETLMLSLSMDDEEDYEYVIEVPWLIYDSNHAGVYNDPDISPALLTSYTFRYLHFVDYTGTQLVVESYAADEVNRLPDQVLIAALELLIEGPRQEGAQAVIPPDTRVRNLEIDGSDLFVDLSRDFMTGFVGGTDLARLMIYSIVNTLISENPRNIFRVHFLIETQQEEVFHGIEDFHLPFEFNESLVVAYYGEHDYAYAHVSMEVHE